MAFLDTLKQGIKDAQSKVDELRGTELEKKVKKATSSAEKWESTSTQKHEIAQATNGYSGYKEVMSTLWKRLNDPDRNWITIIKSLTLLEYLIRMGSERVVEECRERLYQIRTWQDYSFVDKEDRDRGAAIRQKAKEIADLLQDDDKIKRVRKEAQQNFGKYVGVSNEGDVSRAGFGSYGGGGGGGGAFDSYSSSDYNSSYDSWRSKGGDGGDRDGGDHEDKPKKSHHHKKHGDHSHHKHSSHHDKESSSSSAKKSSSSSSRHRSKHSTADDDESGGDTRDAPPPKHDLSGSEVEDADNESSKSSHKKKPIKIKMSEKSEKKKPSRAPALAPPGASEDESDTTPKPFLRTSTTSSERSSKKQDSSPAADLFDPFKEIDRVPGGSGGGGGSSSSSSSSSHKQQQQQSSDDGFGDFESFNPRASGGSSAAVPAARPTAPSGGGNQWDPFAPAPSTSQPPSNSFAPPPSSSFSRAPQQTQPQGGGWGLDFTSFQSAAPVQQQQQRSAAPAGGGGFDLFDTPIQATPKAAVNVDHFFGGGSNTGGGDDDGFTSFQSADSNKPKGGSQVITNSKKDEKKIDAKKSNDAWDIGSRLVDLNLTSNDKSATAPRSAGPVMSSSIRGPPSGPLGLPEARNAPLPGFGQPSMGPSGGVPPNYGRGGFAPNYPPTYPPMGNMNMGMGNMGGMGGMGGMGSMMPPMGASRGFPPVGGGYPAPAAGNRNDPFNFSM